MESDLPLFALPDRDLGRPDEGLPPLPEGALHEPLEPIGTMPESGMRREGAIPGPAPEREIVHRPAGADAGSSRQAATLRPVTAFPEVGVISGGQFVVTPFSRQVMREAERRQRASERRLAADLASREAARRPPPDPEWDPSVDLPSPDPDYAGEEFPIAGWPPPDSQLD